MRDIGEVLRRYFARAIHVDICMPNMPACTMAESQFFRNIEVMGMKKIMISLMMVVTATTTSFAKSNNTDVANAVKSVAEQVKQAPSGTVYGVVENTKYHITVPSWAATVSEPR